MTPEQARAAVADYSLPINADFFTLTREQVQSLNIIANTFKVKRPKGSQGSKARHCYKELMHHLKGESK